MPPADPTVIYETVHGSRAYGLATETSDTDLRGVFVPPPLAFIGYVAGPEQIEPSAERVLFEIRKFFRLAAACNPSVIEVLFTDPEDHVTVSPEGARLLDRRGEFLSRLAGDSFGKYGLAQLHRIKTHRRWLLSPPPAQPDRASYGLPERSTVSRHEQGAAEAMLRDGRLTEAELPPNLLDLLDRERRYRGAAREWQQYQEWTRRRNPVRAELERRYGYDTKHAMHLIRLLRMAVEILTTGQVRVRRPDAEELGLSARAARASTPSPSGRSPRRCWPGLPPRLDPAPRPTSPDLTRQRVSVDWRHAGRQNGRSISERR